MSFNHQPSELTWIIFSHANITAQGMMRKYHNNYWTDWQTPIVPGG